MTKEEALKKALELELDLVEVAAQAKPPVARIVEFEKFRYQESKKEQAIKKHAKEIEQKEIWLSPRIAEHDLRTRLKKAEEFIEKANIVKLTVKFRGREMGHPELGHHVLDQAFEILGDKVKISRDRRFEGRNLTVIIGKK